jgi:polysaccharide export outer membrane protein
MKTNPTPHNRFTHHLPLLKFLALLLAVSVFTGCETSQFGESSRPADSIAANTTHTEMIVLREGDVVKISFPGSANLDTTQQIRRDGKISLPLVGEVQAAGKTPNELQQNLIKLYAPQISSQELTVAVQSSSFPVFVTGCVMHPGKVSSDQPLTALEAIMNAGGFDYAKANLRSVRVIRREKGVSESYTLNLKVVMQGKDNNPFFLKPDDIVFVPEKFSWF